MLVYSYHVYKRHMKAEDLAVCEEQFALAHEYKVQCLKNQRKRLEADRAALRTPLVEEIEAKLTPLRERLDVLWTEARKHRKTERATAVPEVMAEIDKLGAERRPLLEALYAENKRSRGTEAYKAQKPLLQEAHLARARALRAEWSDRVHYASRGLAEAAAEQSFAKALTTGSRICLRQYEGHGAIGGQVMMNKTGYDIVRIPPLEFPMRPSGKPRKVYATFQLKVGGVESAQRWVELPCAVHRPLPDAPIKEARLCRVIEDGQPTYTIRLTVDVDKPMSTSELSFAINFGWRQVDDRLRVGAWQGEDGERGVIELPEAVRHKWNKAAELRSLRADRLNDFRERLKTLTDEPVHLWQSIENVHRLRAKLGEAAPPDLIEWVRRDRHLEHYEYGCRRNAIMLRREIYRVFAAQMAKRYRCVIVEGDIKDETRPVDLSEVQQRSVAASTNSVLASLSEFRQILEHAGMVMVAVDRRSTSAMHHGCGRALDTKKTTVKIPCECGAEVDRDLNAAQNILERGQTVITTALAARAQKQATVQERKAKRLESRLAARKTKTSDTEPAARSVEHKL